MSYQRVIISLVDSYAYLRETYREVATRAMLRHTQKRPTAFPSVVFDPAPFLVKLVQDINLGDQVPKRLGSGADATIQMLVDAGLPGDTARWIYHQIWSQITDQVAALLPEASAGADSAWEYELVNAGMDLVVSCWVEPEQPAEKFTTIMDDIAASKPPPIPTAVAGNRLSMGHHWRIEEPLERQLTSAELEQRYKADYGKGV